MSVSNRLLPLPVALSLALATGNLHGREALPSAPSPGVRGQAPRPPAIRDITSSRQLQCPLTAERGGFAAGVFFGDAASTPERMRLAVQRHVDRYDTAPPLVKTFHSLEDDFSPAGRAGQLLRTLAASPGVTPLLSLEPTWHGSPGTGLLEFIASGRADARLTRVARDLAGIGPGPVLVEFGAEMNARFGAPWQADQNGGAEGPAAFVRAWRHVVRLTRAEGAHNVRWIFAPGAGNPYTHHPTGPAHWNWYGHWYPGDAYVDYMGLHAFNHAREQEAWVPFIELVTGDAADGMLDDMIARFPAHRIVLGELATSEHPGQPEAKAGWIDDAYQRMRDCPAIAGAVWFDMNKETDWHVDSSPQSAAAYRAAARTTGVHGSWRGADRPAVAAARTW